MPAIPLTAPQLLMEPLELRQTRRCRGPCSGPGRRGDGLLALEHRTVVAPRRRIGRARGGSEGKDDEGSATEHGMERARSGPRLNRAKARRIARASGGETPQGGGSSIHPPTSQNGALDRPMAACANYGRTSLPVRAFGGVLSFTWGTAAGTWWWTTSPTSTGGDHPHHHQRINRTAPSVPSSPVPASLYAAPARGRAATATCAPALCAALGGDRLSVARAA